MCDYCGHANHDPRCPEYSRASWGVCAICGGAIRDGDEYVEEPRETHLTCLIDLIDSDPREALDRLGIEIVRAGE